MDMKYRMQYKGALTKI